MICNSEGSPGSVRTACYNTVITSECYEFLFRLRCQEHRDVCRNRCLNTRPTTIKKKKNAFQHSYKKRRDDAAAHHSPTHTRLTTVFTIRISAGLRDSYTISLLILSSEKGATAPAARLAHTPSASQSFLMSCTLSTQYFSFEIDFFLPSRKCVVMLQSLVCTLLFPAGQISRCWR